jgi:cytochrome c553
MGGGNADDNLRSLCWSCHGKYQDQNKNINNINNINNNNDKQQLQQLQTIAVATSETANNV